jgi:hypothetical protein
VAVISRRTVICAALAAGVLVSGCGDSNDNGQAQEPLPVPSPQDFPKPQGRSLQELWNQYGAGGPVLSPSVSRLTTGSNRFGFGLFDRARAQIADAPAAVYVAPAGRGAARGPYPARYESLAVKPQFQSRSVSEDPSSAKTVYVADVPFKEPGRYHVLGMARLDDRLVTAAPAGPALRVVDRDAVPGVGDRAPRTETPTVASVGGDVQKIDTRTPPSDMHEVNFADVVGKEPVILLFATPALCQSRVCGPVVDIAEQVKADHEDEAEFIHMEIFNNNDVAQGYRPQVREWNLPTEPWVFAIDRKGRVAARIEGAFSADELEAALKKATQG